MWSTPPDGTSHSKMYIIHGEHSLPMVSYHVFKASQRGLATTNGVSQRGNKERTQIYISKDSHVTCAEAKHLQSRDWVSTALPTSNPTPCINEVKTGITVVQHHRRERLGLAPFAGFNQNRRDVSWAKHPTNILRRHTISSLEGTTPIRAHHP